MKIKVSNGIYLPKSEYKNIDIKKYIYEKNDGTFVQSFLQDEEHIILPRNLYKFQ